MGQTSPTIQYHECICFLLQFFLFFESTKARPCQSATCKQRKKEKRLPAGVAKSRCVRKLAALSQSSRSPQACKSSSSDTPSTGKHVALILNVETTHRSPDAQCDGTEELSSRRLDAMPCKIAKDLALHHNPSSEADKVFTIKTMQNACQTFGVPGDSLGIRDVPVNQAMWRVFMNSCMWATVHLSKDGDQFPRVRWDMNVQNLIQVLQEEKLYRLTDQRDRTEGHLKSYSLFDQGIHNKCSQKCMSSPTQCYVLVENANPVHDWERFGSRNKLRLLSNLVHIANSLTSLVSQSFSSGGFTQDTSVPFQDADHLFYWCVTTCAMKTDANKIHHAYPLKPGVFRQGAGHSSAWR